MTTEEILKSLCYYDERNPDSCTDDDEETKAERNLLSKKCYCDNCFYGRTELAIELLKFITICAIQ